MIVLTGTRISRVKDKEPKEQEAGAATEGGKNIKKQYWGGGCLGPLIVKEINIILKSMLLDDNVTYLATLSIPL